MKLEEIKIEKGLHGDMEHFYAGMNDDGDDFIVNAYLKRKRPGASHGNSTISIKSKEDISIYSEHSVLDKPMKVLASMKKEYPVEFKNLNDSLFKSMGFSINGLVEKSKGMSMGM